MKRQTGEYEQSVVAGETVNAFIPYALPPSDPPVALDGDLAPLLARAQERLRLLDLAGDLVPSWSGSSTHSFVKRLFSPPRSRVRRPP